MSTLNSLNIPAGTWNLDSAHSEVGFTARHAGISKVRGKFTDVEASAIVPAGNPEKTVINARIKADSFDSGNADRDAHVKSGDFLEVETYPELSFVATSIEEDGDELLINGDLTIKGVTKPVKFDVEVGGVATDPFGNVRVGLEAKTIIRRKDFGLTWNAVLDAGGLLVSEKVALNLELSFIHAGE